MFFTPNPQSFVHLIIQPITSPAKQNHFQSTRKGGSKSFMFLSKNYFYLTKFVVKLSSP